MKKIILILSIFFTTFNSVAEVRTGWKTGPWLPSNKYYSCESSVESTSKGLYLCYKWIYSEQREVKCPSNNCFKSNKPNSYRLRRGRHY